VTILVKGMKKVLVVMIVVFEGLVMMTVILMKLLTLTPGWLDSL
jgi:hypothetical protein